MSVFIVAEAGVNHLGDRAKMLALCDAAKAAGADAVKFQAYDVDKLAERRGYYDWSRDWGEVGDGTPQPKPEHAETVALLEESQLSDADLDAIAAHCKAIGIKWFASVFDPSQVERVLSRGACALKIGHAEADWEELVDACVDRADTWASTLPGAKQPDVLCVPHYPADGHDPCLGQIDPDLCGHASGFSSHYTDYRIPAAAALRGAEYIEAHLCLEIPAYRYAEDWGETMGSKEPEAAWSLCPRDFAKMVKLIREYSSWL